MAAADIAAELRRLAPHSDTSFVLDTLEYMWKGGRCSGVAALGANMLKLKPCLEMREGKLVVCKKYRGSMDKVYRQYIAERLAGKAVVADHAFITHSGEVPEEMLSQLTALVRELAPFEEVFVTQAGCTVSSHCGPGHAGRAVPAEGVTKPEIGSRRRRLMPAPSGFALWEKKERKLSADPATPL